MWRPHNGASTPYKGMHVTEYTTNHILPVRVENIPEELKVRPQWVVWQAVGEKPDQVPY